ncbi:MAG TPA: fibronectin type III-like domain-contianing protein, partial [Verrucomicrobiae bacterium]|nr:fibronectin type III-like domain-contianing protein [Verrucomicrobiae bacterium]
DHTEDTASDTVKLSVNVSNTGERDGDEVVQVYFRHVNPPEPQPKEALCSFARIHLPHGKTARLTLNIPVNRFRCWDPDKKQYNVELGNYELLIGSASDDIRQRLLLSIGGQ